MAQTCSYSNFSHHSKRPKAINSANNSQPPHCNPLAEASAPSSFRARAWQHTSVPCISKPIPEYEALPPAACRRLHRPDPSGKHKAIPATKRSLPLLLGSHHPDQGSLQGFRVVQSSPPKPMPQQTQTNPMPTRKTNAPHNPAPQTQREQAAEGHQPREQARARSSGLQPNRTSLCKAVVEDRGSSISQVGWHLIAQPTRGHQPEAQAKPPAVGR